MQISNFGGIPVLNSNLQTNTAKTLQNIPMPKFVNYFATRDDVNHILTKTEATRSDEEILNDLIELTERFVQQSKGTTEPGKMPASMLKESNKLLGEFMAPYSPDREAIFTKGFESTQKEIKSRISKPMLDTSLITVLFGKNKVSTSIWFAPNDKRVIEIDNMRFVDENGEHIGSYHRNLGCWTVALTEAERERTAIFNGVYQDTVKTAMANKSAGTNANTTNNVPFQQNQAAQTQTTTAQQAASRYEQMQFAEHKG